MIYLKYWKIGLVAVIVIALGSIGFFAKQYLENINQEKLELSLSLSQVNEQLNSEMAYSGKVEQSIDSYARSLYETNAELDRVKDEHAKIEGQINEIQFAKHFEKWATTNPDRLSECLESSLNFLFDNLSAATANQVSTHQNSMPCAPKDGASHHPADIAKAGQNDK